MILLTTANARYSHTSLGLRYLYANMQELQTQTNLLEHTIKDNPQDMVDQWIAHQPKIIGVGIYIWNVEVLSRAIAILKNDHPQIVIVVGGPEVSYGISDELSGLVDYIIPLEGDHSFRRLCQNILANNAPKTKVLATDSVDVKALSLPYAFYSDKDIQHRKIYVEASRGCAFKCQFCLSSLDKGIRTFETDLFLSEIKTLYQRGARQFKFVDRTFNLHIKQSIAILSFFLEEFPEQDYFLHFEVIPDRLPPALKAYIIQFHAGVLQFEVGIQTLDQEVSALIGRRQDEVKALENLAYLRQNTHIHLHVDLIIGLPGATFEIFRRDLNQLIAVGLQEVQIGILKYLKGTPIVQHNTSHRMVYDAMAPYEIESNIDLGVNVMNQLKRFAKYWDHYYNSGNFIQSMKFLFQQSNPFDEFFKLSEYAHAHFQRTHGIALDQYSELLYNYLVLEHKKPSEKIRELILKDTLIKPGRKVPKFLKVKTLDIPLMSNRKSSKFLDRQSNHSV